MEKKFLSGAPRSATPTTLPFRCSSEVMPLPLADSSRMQPPWIPVVMRTSNPCSSGFSQRSAMPTPASALPVAIASSNWSVEPPKLIRSTSRLRLVKYPFCCATGTPTVQMALAFQVNFTVRRWVTTVTGTVAAALQIGGAIRSSGMAGRLPANTRVAIRPSGAATPAA